MERVVQLRCTREEHDAWTRAAAEAGVGLSEWIRGRLSREAVVREADEGQTAHEE